MRKITRNAATAFQSGKRFSCSNTTVSVIDGTATMYLHGNAIATLTNGKLMVNHCKWTTRTTKERLNGLDGVNIVQKNHIWYLNGAVMADGWNEVLS
jgi:uncharacterized heparinase superfamily protein